MSEVDAKMTTDSNYEILAQIYSILHDKKGQKSIAMKKVLEKKFDINYSVPNSKCTLTKIVGRTALDFALDTREWEVFEMFIKHGANFTNTNQSGSTILHRIIEKSYVHKEQCHKLKGILVDPFVESVLSAHVEMKKVANPHNQDGISHFHIACMFNHVEAVKFFLAQGVDVNQAIDRDSKIFPGYTPLHLATRYSAFETAKLLLDHDADANLRDARGMYPMFLLIERNNEISDWENVQKNNLCKKLKEELLNNEKIIRLLLEKSNNTEIGLPRCHVICTLRDTQELVQAMTEDVKLGEFIDRNSPFRPGYTALHFAAIFNSNAVKLLVINGADIMAVDANGVTPFDLCLQRYSPETIHSIVSMVPELNKIMFNNTKTNLADLILAMSDEATLRSFLQEKAENVNMNLPFDSPVWPGYTILHIAVILSDRIHDFKCLYGDTDYVNDFEMFNKCHEEQEYFKRIKLCLTMGADIIITDFFNSSPLHLAFQLQNQHIVELLLEYHHKLVNVTDNGNLSHLHIACTVERHDLVENLLGTGVDVNLPVMFNYRLSAFDYDEETLKVFDISPGWTCLHIAVASLNRKLVNILLRYGANLNAKDSYEMTVIHLVLHAGYERFNKHRLTRKYYSNQVTYFGLSHLHVACFDGDIEQVKDLIKHGADIEAKINYNLVCSHPALAELAPYDGYTPLHFALEKHHFEIVKLLVERGANLFSKSADGSIPFYETLKNSFDMYYYDYSDYSESYASSYSDEYQSDYDDDDDGGDCDDDSACTFALQLFSDKKIKRMIKKHSGITKLHIACLGLRRKLVIKLLEKGADPNARIRAGSPIWSGFTSLHILMIPRSVNDDEDNFWDIYQRIERLGKSLLKYGASVTLKDTEGNTPIHKASDLLWSIPQITEDTHNIEGLFHIRWILEGYRDFSINPVDARGITHFDVACMILEKQVVENFLQSGVDVNRHFGHFSKYYGGFTALHLASFYKDDETVQLLLKNGANYHAKDFLGNTPFHTAGVYCQFGNNGYRLYNEYIYCILLSAGADNEAKNLWDETPLAVILRMNLLISGTLYYFTENHSYRLNIFNPDNEEGLLGVALYVSRHTDVENMLFYKAVVNDPKSNGEDEMGRTVIHNIVSVNKREFGGNFGSIEEYTRIINRFIKLDFDIDCQDNKGQTALHKAIRFNNYNATIALLNNGADINIADTNNKPAFSYCVENKEGDEDIRRSILKSCLLHVYKLQIAGLEISNANQNLAALIREESISCHSEMERYSKELEILKNYTIAKSYSITMYNFLSETLNYYHMLVFLCDDIDELFVTNISLLHKTFPVFAGLLQMQHRNIFIRLQLIEPAKSALNVLARFSLPDLCSEQIVKLLRNTDLKRLIVGAQ